MILDEIVFQNFGVYRGRQPLALTPPSLDKPIILLGGLNGGGKTTMLDGLQLALYGKNAHCSNRGELGYDEFLRRSVHRMIDPHEGASIELGFRHTTQGKEHAYRVQRSWSENGRGIKENVSVTCDGVLDSTLSEHWAEQVDSFIPHGISELFFFDGEKVEQLADFGRASRVLSTAIHSLLGIELVDRLNEDLIVMERRKRVLVRSDAIRTKISECDEDIRRLEELHETAAQDRASAQNESDRAEKLLRQLKDQFKREGGDLAAQREQIGSEKTIAETNLQQAEQELRDIAAGAAPLLLVRDLLEAVEKQVDAETDRQESKVLSKVLKARDKRLIVVLEQAGCTSKIVEAAKRFCDEDRERRLLDKKGECYILLEAKAQEELRSVRKMLLPEISVKAAQLVGRVAEAKDKIEKLEQLLASIPDPEALEGLRTSISEAEKACVEAKARLAGIDNRERQLATDLERKRVEREALLMADIDDEMKHLDNVRILQHSEKVRSTLQQFRVAVVQRHVSRIEYLILDSFKQLLRKKSLVSEVRIDATDFALDLRGGDGKPLSSERLSAGERQLLAVSMLWGLARASGRPLPTIIDTPLGRLDASHRTNLVERYLPYASHQVVLLSTDEEIDQGLFTKLEPHIGRKYRLNFDDKTSSTSIEEGYFWKS